MTFCVFRLGSNAYAFVDPITQKYLRWAGGRELAVGGRRPAGGSRGLAGGWSAFGHQLVPARWAAGGPCMACQAGGQPWRHLMSYQMKIVFNTFSTLSPHPILSRVDPGRVFGGVD